MIIRKATFQDAVILAENQVRMAMESENMKLDYQTVIKGTEAYLNDPGREPATWPRRTVRSQDL